jgi:hypothetical protein
MQSSPLPCYLIPLGPKYPPQHFNYRKPSAYTYTTNKIIIKILQRLKILSILLAIHKIKILIHLGSFI